MPHWHGAAVQVRHSYISHFVGDGWTAKDLFTKVSVSASIVAAGLLKIFVQTRDSVVASNAQYYKLRVEA